MSEMRVSACDPKGHFTVVVHGVPKRGTP